MMRQPAAADDSFFSGALRLRQHSRGAGYRVNADAFFLARAASERGTARHALDLGAGSGAIGLSLLALGVTDRVTLVELDPLSADLATHNASAFGKAATVVRGDVASTLPLETSDLVVCNPPYTPRGNGVAPPELGRARARHGPIAPFVACAARSLCAGGVAYFVYPAAAVVELLAAAASERLAAVALRFIHPKPGAAARLAVASFGLDAGAALSLRAPWFETEFDPSRAGPLHR